MIWLDKGLIRHPITFPGMPFPKMAHLQLDNFGICLGIKVNAAGRLGIALPALTLIPNHGGQARAHFGISESIAFDLSQARTLNAYSTSRLTSETPVAQA